MKKLLTNVNEIDDYYPVSCKITASAVDRTSNDNGDIVGPLNAYKYAVGTEIELSDVKFNVISVDGDSLSLLSQEYFKTTGHFSSTDDENALISFSSTAGWSYTPGPKEIDVSVFSSISPYFRWNVSVFYDDLGSDNFTMDLISLKELRNLGCTISNDYSEKQNLSCANSPYADWLVSGVSWWTKSASSSNQYNVWVVGENGVLTAVDCSTSNAIRPVIHTTITALENDILPFSIDGVTYESAPPRTWREWINSEYNVDGYRNSGGVIISPNGDVVYDVDANDVIIHNHDYRTVYYFDTRVRLEDTGEVVYVETFITYANSTWEDFINSELNVGSFTINASGYVMYDSYTTDILATSVIEEDFTLDIYI